jgi:hypothetical protein
LVLEAPGIVLFGPLLVENVAGKAAAAGRRWDAAEAHFQKAMLLAKTLPVATEQPEVRRFYAQMLIDRDEPGDRAKARELLEEAIGAYARLGMRRHRELAQSLMVSAIATETTRPPTAAVQAPARDAPAQENHFRKEGDYWTISFRGKISRLKESAGFLYIAHLLRHPNHEFHVLDLGAITDDKTDVLVGTDKGVNLDETQLGLGDAGEILDAQAKSAYRDRVEDLREELQEAETFNDTGRATKARQEIEVLTAELARGVGLGGRDRRAASAAERARQRVAKAVRVALKRIAEHDPSLGRNLSRMIKTGIFCSYVPDPDAPISWIL